MKSTEFMAALGLVVVGVLLLINNLAWGYDVGRLISDWWPMLLIGLGILHVIKGVTAGTPIAGGLVLTMVGLAFQAHRLRPELSVGELFGTYWPLALIAIGISQLLMFGRGRWYSPRARG